MKFSELEIHPDLIKAATDAGFVDLTPIQEQCLQPAIDGYDISGIAQTGTGKTVAFLLPILNRILTDEFDTPAALIIAPTRELCLQITEQAEMLTKFHPLKITSIYGGEGYKRQEADLAENPHIIVATPGRLIDYLKQKKIRTSNLKFLVLDEADRMFDMGFIRDVRYIMKHAPEDTQTMLFSATMSYYVMRLASDFMKDPVQVQIESESVAVDKIDQRLLHLGREEKQPYLVNLILNEDNIRAIVFTNTRHMVQRLTERLRKYGIAATGISSLLDQKKRISLLKDFKLGKTSVLVATDVASRGLDIDDITHVINFDLPQDAESYVHRIGRTARAGRTGTSVSFSSEDDYDNLPRIQRYLGNKIPIGEVNEDYVKFPEGDFKPFREPGGRRSEKEAPGASGEGRPGERSGRGDQRKKRKRKYGSRQDQRESKYPEQAERQPEESPRKRTQRPAAAERGTSASIRSADREAILSGINTAAGSRMLREEQARTSEAPPSQRKKGGKKSGKQGQKRKDYDKSSRRDERQTGSSGQKGRRRDDRDKERSRDRRGARKAATAPAKKKGIVGKILSFFGKKK